MAMMKFFPGDTTINPYSGATASTYLFAGGLALLIIGWAALRYWLATSNKKRVQEVDTPTIDRLNVQALSRIDDQNALPMEPLDEPAPDDLLAALSQQPPENNESVARAHQVAGQTEKK